MSKPFDLKKQLKLHSRDLLRELVAREVPRDETPRFFLQQRQGDPIVAAWEDLEPHCVPLQRVLQDVHELADFRGIPLLLSVLNAREPANIGGLECLPKPGGQGSLGISPRTRVV